MEFKIEVKCPNCKKTYKITTKKLIPGKYITCPLLFERKK